MTDRHPTVMALYCRRHNSPTQPTCDVSLSFNSLVRHDATERLRRRVITAAAKRRDNHTRHTTALARSAVGTQPYIVV